MAAFASSFGSSVCFRYIPKIHAELEKKWPSCCAVRCQEGSKSGNSGRSYRQVWRRRKLTQKDRMAYNLERVPFLEERIRKIKEGGGQLAGDTARLLMSEDNRFDFVNEVAAEAKQYVENNRDEYGAKKAVLHVLSNRMRDAGFDCPEAYMEVDPFKPGPEYLRNEQEERVPDLF